MSASIARTVWHSPVLMHWLSLAMLLGALLGFASGTVYWLTHRNMFTIQSITLASATTNDSAPTTLRHVNVPTSRAAALPRILNGTRLNFFTVNLETIRQAFESVAWVRRAQVSRLWPNRLLVRVEEHEVLGSWNDSSNANEDTGGSISANTFVNTYGELFAVNPAEAEDDADDNGLPEFSGPVGSEKMVVARYRELSTRFAPLQLTPDQISLSSRYAWNAHFRRADGGGYDDEVGNANTNDLGLTVELGREIEPNILARRIDRMFAAYPQVTAKWPRPTLIDLRYSNGFVLRAQSLKLADENTAGHRPAAKAAAKPTLKSKHT